MVITKREDVRKLHLRGSLLFNYRICVGGGFRMGGNSRLDNYPNKYGIMSK